MIRLSVCIDSSLQLVEPSVKFACMIARPFWQKGIEEAWREAPIAWLAGVRGSGKTVLAEGLGAERVLYLNCDLPSVG